MAPSLRLAAGVGLLLLALANAVVAWPSETRLLRDLPTLIHSAELWEQGQNPYDLANLEQTEFRGHRLYFVNANPPLGVLLYVPFAFHDQHAAGRNWFVLSIACYAATVGLLLAVYRAHATATRVVWAAAAAPFWGTLTFYQLYTLLGLAVGGCYAAVHRHRPILGGLALGALIALKPNFALVPVILLAAGHWRVALATVPTALGLTAAAAVVSSPSLLLDWVAVTSREPVWPGLPANASLPGLLARADAPSLIGTMLAASIALVGCVQAYRQRWEVELTLDRAIALTLLVSPLAWMEYLLLLLPAMLRRPATRAWWLVALLWLLPLEPAWDTAVRIPDDVAYGIASSVHTVVLLATVLLVWSPPARTSEQPGAASETRQKILSAPSA